jgi:TatD DNase family protein
MAELFDTHCHLLADRFSEDLENVIKRAEENQVTRMVTVALGPDSEQLVNSLELIKKHPSIFLAAALHPHSAKDENDDFYNVIKNNINDISIWGEIGLDYHYDFSPRDIQKKVFINQLQMAKSFNKRVMLHIREAHEDTIDILKSYPPIEGSVVHCFTGSINDVKSYLDMGFYISFSGIVTFPKASDLQKAAKYVPMDRILVETDSPYLAPVPFRGKRSEPFHVKYTAKKIAELKSMDFDLFCKTTTQNGINALLNSKLESADIK